MAKTPTGARARDTAQPKDAVDDTAATDGAPAPATAEEPPTEAPAATDQTEAPTPPDAHEPDGAPSPTTPEQDETPPEAEEPHDAADDVPEQLPPGVYEYIGGIGCVYPHIPLTCRAYHPPVPATDTAPEIAERVATVFDWPDGPPMDGRWAPTEKTPNQVADNAGGLLSGKE